MLKLRYTDDEIARSVQNLASQIDHAYKDITQEDPLVVIGVLRGALYFLADLTRLIKKPILLDTLTASSYGLSLESSGTVSIIHPPRISLTHRRILLVDEILDSGHTLMQITKYLYSEGALDVKTAILIEKKRPREMDFQPDFCGFTSADGFLVGYGMDLRQQLRHLPCIYEYTE